MVLITGFHEQKISLYANGIFDSGNEKFIIIDRNSKLVSEHAELIKSQIFALTNPVTNHTMCSDSVTVDSNKKPGISLKDVPIFNVDPSLDCWNVSENNKEDMITLTIFLLRFERLFATNNVDINKSWLYYLDISFEGAPKYHNWFTLNLKDVKDISWLEAKNILQQRFDLASQASVQSHAVSLTNFSLEENESFILCLERYRMLILKAKINITDNVMLFYFFIKCFSSKVQEKVNEIISNNFRITSPNDIDNVKIHHAPACWATFEKIITGHIAAIEEVLLVSRSQKINYKKRKANMVEEVQPEPRVQNVPFVASGPSSSAASQYANLAALKDQGICTYCRTVNFRQTKNHQYTCEAKIAFYKKRNYKMPTPDVSVNNINIVQNKGVI
jgi:hypothetical protein